MIQQPRERGKMGSAQDFQRRKHQPTKQNTQKNKNSFPKTWQNNLWTDLGSAEAETQTALSPATWGQLLGEESLGVCSRAERQSVQHVLGLPLGRLLLGRAQNWLPSMWRSGGSTLSPLLDIRGASDTGLHFPTKLSVKDVNKPSFKRNYMTLMQMFVLHKKTN